MIKQFGTIDQLKELTNEQLYKLAEKCHIRSEKEIETDERALYEFRKFMRGSLSIGNMINLLIEDKRDITWDSDSTMPVEYLIVDGKEFRYKELHDCLWEAVKWFVLEMR